MPTNYVDIEAMKLLKQEIDDIKQAIAVNMKNANESIGDMIEVLGNSSNVSKSITRFENASQEECDNIVKNLEKLSVWLDGKITNYQTIYNVGAQNIAAATKKEA